MFYSDILKTIMTESDVIMLKNFETKDATMLLALAYDGPCKSFIFFNLKKYLSYLQNSDLRD